MPNIKTHCWFVFRLAYRLINSISIRMKLKLGHESQHSFHRWLAIQTRFRLQQIQMRNHHRLQLAWVSSENTLHTKSQQCQWQWQCQWESCANWNDAVKQLLQQNERDKIDVDISLAISSDSRAPPTFSSCPKASIRSPVKSYDFDSFFFILHVKRNVC